MKTDKTERGKKLAAIGSILQLGPLIGGAATGIGMIHAFNVLQKANISDPRELAGKMGEILIFTAICLIIGTIGLALICIALFTSTYRSPLIFWILVINGVVYLFGFPIGTIIGACILFYCVSHRAEFRKNKSNVAPNCIAP